MNTAILRRLAWKEFRILGGFALAVMVLCCVCLLIMAWRMKTTADPASLFFVAMGITACYALGCGAVAFAGEREARTDDFQRVLPVSPRQLLLGKLLHALTSALVLGSVVWAIAWLAARWLWRGYAPGTSAAMAGLLPAVLGGLTTVQMLAWGILFSLYSSSPLRVVILAFLANTLVSYPIALLCSDVPEYYRTILYFPSFFGDLPTVIPRLIVVAIVLGLDFRLVRRWCRESPSAVADATGPTMATVTASAGGWNRWNADPQWRRLTWQAWRTGKSLLWPITLTYLFLVAAVLTLNMPSGYQAGTLLAPLVVVGGLLGTLVFHHDQRRRQFRFLAEHGVSPRRLWWARQSSWLPALLVCCLVLPLLEFICFHTWVVPSFPGPREQLEFPDLVGAILGLTLLSYCTGQLLSLWVRSAVIRVALTALAAILLGIWAALMAAFRIPLVWSVAPIPLVLWWASRVTLRDWMLERSGFAVSLKKTLVLVMPALAIAAGAIAYRWTEIPATEPVFTSPPLTAAEREAATRKGVAYLRAMASFDPWWHDLPASPEWEDHNPKDSLDPTEFALGWLSTEQIQWLDQHREVIERVLDVPPGDYILPPIDEYRAELAADERVPKSSGFGGKPSVDEFYAVKVIRLPHVLVTSAQQCQRAGDLDGALDRYIAALRFMRGPRDLTSATGQFLWGYERITLHHLRYWASEPQQTPERIRRAVHDLEQIPIQDAIPDLERSLQPNYLLARRCIAGDEAALRQGQDAWGLLADADSAYYRWCFRFLPWERQRALRLEAASAARALTTIHQLRRALAQHAPVQLRSGRDEEKEWMHWFATTISPARLWPDNWSREAVCLGEFISIQRATLIVLALQGWRLEHGTLPRTLDELSPAWFAHIPVDPWTGTPFEYYPDGLREQTAWRDDMWYWGTFTLPPQRPLLKAQKTGPYYAESQRTSPDSVPHRRIFPIPISEDK